MSRLLGVTFDESAFNEDQDLWILQNLSGAGFRSLELALHPRALGNARAGKLRTAGQNLGFSFAFHAPDFIDPEIFDLRYAMSSEHSRGALRNWIEQCGDFGDNVQLIFHGAPDQTATFRFVDFALEWIEKTRGSQRLLIENTFSAESSEVRYGQKPEALLQLIQVFSGSSLGLCLDIAHWLRALNQGIYPKGLVEQCASTDFDSEVLPEHLRIPVSLLPFIQRLHLHSVDSFSGKDHQGMTSRDRPAALLLSPWYRGTEQPVRNDCHFSIEILASRLQEVSWLSTVLESGAWLRALPVLDRV